MSRIDFVTGAPILYAEEVSQVANLTTLTNKALKSQKKQTETKNDAKSNEDEWSIHRILCHMLNYSLNINLLVKRMLIDTDPTQKLWNENELYIDLNQSKKSTLNIFNQFKKSVEALVVILSETPDAAWGRAGNHIYLGRISVKQLVKWHYNHLIQHIEQIDKTIN